MDGDLQNPPEDVPRSSRRSRRGTTSPAAGAPRGTTRGGTLPSRLDQRMLRRFTGVDISDFGCAFNAYRREAVEPMLGAIGRQKFTKALVSRAARRSWRSTSGTRRARDRRATRRSG